MLFNFLTLAASDGVFSWLPDSHRTGTCLSAIWPGTGKSSVLSLVFLNGGGSSLWTEVETQAPFPLRKLRTQRTQLQGTSAMLGENSTTSSAHLVFYTHMSECRPCAQALQVQGWNGSGLHGGQRPRLVHLQGNNSMLLAQCLGHGNCSLNACLMPRLKMRSLISRSSQFSAERQMDT